MEIKTKINKRDLVKLKSFCTAKETTNKMKRPPSEWERIILVKTTDKELISKIYKLFMQLYTRKKKNNKKKPQSKSGWRDISPTKTYRWLTNT